MATVERRRRRYSDGTLSAVRYTVRWRDLHGKRLVKTFSRRRDATVWAAKIRHTMERGADGHRRTTNPQAR